jgi:hypothetical protein
MKDIQYVRINGFFKVSGIYNYNGSEQRQGNNNHKGAKQDRTGRDYTSSRCIRHEMFKDLQPRQPSSKEFSDYFVNLAASEVGLLRGYLAPDEGFKRNSPIHVSDAYTEGDIAVIYDQGVSSKPKESQKTGKKGDAVSDNSIFSQDNAPDRRQTLVSAINLKELQFLSLDDIDPSFRMVSANDEGLFLSLLEKYFKASGIDHNVIASNYKDISAVLNTKRRGILLNQHQVRHLVKISISRIMSIDGLKAGSFFKTDIPSLKIIIGRNLEGVIEEQSINYSEFLNKLPDCTFKEYYTKG